MWDLMKEHEVSKSKFMDCCKDKFGWKDLSKDVIMDVGFGMESCCGKAILDMFPNVGPILAIDNDPLVFVYGGGTSTDKITYELADIEKRETLRKYEGKMTKVFSTYVFHHLADKEEVLRNVFHLLKPEGEFAALFLSKSFGYDWLTEMFKNPKWKRAYKYPYVEDKYPSGFGESRYIEMAQKIGFEVLEVREEKKELPYPSDAVCKDEWYKENRDSFKLSPESVQEFREESFQVFSKLSPRDSEGRLCYRLAEMSLFLRKPSSGSVTKK